MLYLTCTTMTSVDLTLYGVSRAKDWVSVDCGTRGNRDNLEIISHITSYLPFSETQVVTSHQNRLESFLIRVTYRHETTINFTI